MLDFLKLNFVNLKFDYELLAKFLEIKQSDSDYQRIIMKDINKFFQGIQLFYHHNYKRDLDEPKTILKIGSSCLVEFVNSNSQGNKILLLVPSLINKSYILDLKKERSLARFLSSQGYKVYLIQWNNPQLDEYDFGMEEYIKNRLNLYIKFIYKTHNVPIILAGYCLGGVMVLASTLLSYDKIKALILLATPWDFSPIYNSAFTDNLQLIERSIIENKAIVPAAFIQNSFYLCDAERVFYKFVKFSKLNQSSSKAELFVAIEQWVNDGIGITYKVFKDCTTLFRENLTINNKWEICNRVIIPEEIKVPCFLATPVKDKIVPLHSTLALINKLPNKCVNQSKSGHVSLVVGKDAPRELWKPLSLWLSTI